MPKQKTALPCRSATAADASVISHLVVAAWRHAYADLIPASFLKQLDPAAIAAKWQRDTVSLGVFRRVVTLGDKVVGACSGGPVRDSDSASDVAELYSINVHPECWGNGVGYALLQCAVSAMTENGFSSAILWVLSGNARAQRFYSNAGWHVTGDEKCTTELTGTPLHEVCFRLTF